MSQSPLRHDEGSVISASPQWTGRIAELLGCTQREPSNGSSSIIYCSNVYETTAAVIELHQRKRPVRVGIMVDYLPARELRVFEALSGMDRVRTVAVSAAGRRDKLVQALQLGADETVSLEGRQAFRFTETQAKAEGLPKTISPPAVASEPRKFSHIQRPMATAGSAEDSLLDLAAKDIASARKRQEEQKNAKAEPQKAVTKPVLQHEQPAEPLLSDEERQALLG